MLEEWQNFFLKGSWSEAVAVGKSQSSGILGSGVVMILFLITVKDQQFWPPCTVITTDFEAEVY